MASECSRKGRGACFTLNKNLELIQLSDEVKTGRELGLLCQAVSQVVNAEVTLF